MSLGEWVPKRKAPAPIDKTSYQYWETVATNLDEFLEISVRASAYLYIFDVLLYFYYCI